MNFFDFEYLPKHRNYSSDRICYINNRIREESIKPMARLDCRNNSDIDSFSNLTGVRLYVQRVPLISAGLICLPHQAESYMTASKPRAGANTIGRPTGAGVVIPSAASLHPVRSRWRSFRVIYRSQIIACIPVLAPLKHISMHVI